MNPSTKGDILHQGNSIVSIEKLSDYSQPVVVKQPSKNRTSRRIMESLEREYEMTLSLGEVEGVRKALGQKQIEDQQVLILEYIDGETLLNHVSGNQPDLRSRLETAIDLARILGKIHQQNIIHLDLNSKNILIGNKQQAVHFIDLGSASYIDSKDYQRVRPDQLLGTLPYISPEQTGRINREVDERSDLYSLGVVLYELMTGQLPFNSKDPNVLIHHHIALEPVSPSEVSPEIPFVIGTIIMKLLNKEPEERYQSAAGVLADLEICLHRLMPDNAIEEFHLGKSDSARRLKFPPGLYGRERELKELRSTFKNASRESPAMVFVSGFSGIGKTVLVEELHQPVSKRNGYFIKGKFDQYLRRTPYTGFSEAIASLVSQILTQPESNFIEWQENVQSAVGDFGKVITEIIPALEELIGVQPDVPELGGPEAENRFHYVFMNFLFSIATEKHPLVLFIDDVQWIDPASLKLLKLIKSEFNQPGLMVVGAYRDNEVSPSHPLMEIIDMQEAKGIQVRGIKLNDLREQHLKMFLSDTLGSKKDIDHLWKTIQEKTLGNPFFMRRLLSALNNEGDIRYNTEAQSWEWEIEKISKKKIEANAADLLTKSISQLPEASRNILNLAACLGNRFEITTLVMISGLARQKVTHLLTPALIGQYLIKSANAYEFVHDQVQQSAYNLINGETRVKKHLEIGRILLADTEESALEEKIFDIVGQYNLGANLLTDPSEKIQLAGLNLRAGHRSRNSSAFSAAYEYLKQGLSLLDDNKWQDHYQLTLDIHNELIETSHLTGQYPEVSSIFKTIIDHARQDVDLSVAYKTMILYKIGENELNESISMAEGYLERLDITFDNERISTQSIDELINLPPIKDLEKLAALDILLTITTPVIFAAPERLSSLIFTMLNIISRHGNSHLSGPAYTWYAQNLCMLKQYKEGNLFGQLSVDLIEKFPSAGMASKTMDIYYAFVHHWEVSVHDLIEPLKAYYHVGILEGDFEWAIYCLLNYTLFIWAVGEPLDIYLSEVEPSIEICKSKNQEVSLLMFLLHAQSALNLKGEAADTTILEGKWFSEKEMMPMLEGIPMVLTLYGLLKITLNYLFNKPEEAYGHIDDTLKYREALNPHYLYTKISFYGALSCLAILADKKNEVDRKDCMEKLELFEQEMALWAEEAPMNYQHEYYLVLAEKSRVLNNPWEAVQFYEKAIEGALENHFVHEEALARELYACFWQEHGKDHIAQMYMHEARALYYKWGADAKVSHLENKYPLIFRAEILSDRQVGTDSNVLTTINRPITPIQMELEDILTASRALSTETDFKQLLIKMMELVISNSGAEKAVLLLRQQEKWFVQAMGDIRVGKHDILLNRPYDPAKSDNVGISVPGSTFEYCQRSKQALVLGNVQLDHRFNEDKTFRKFNIKSVACIPIMSQDKLRGMLYLENGQLADVFTLERVEILKHLSSQFGVSVENALLYDSLKLKIQELQRSEMSLKGLMEQSLLAIELLTTEGQIIQVNTAWMRLWNLNEEETAQVLAKYNMLTDKQISDLGIAPLVKKAFTGEPVVLPPVKYVANRTIKYLGLNKMKGNAPWIQCHLSPVRNENQEILFIVNTNVDLTEYKRAEEKLTQAEQRYRTVADFTYDWEWWLGPDGKYIYVSPSCERITGYKPGEFISKPHLLEEIILPEDRKMWDEHIKNAQSERKPREIQFRIKRKDGADRWIEHASQPVRNAEGVFSGFRASNRDITDRKKAENLLQLSERSLSQAQKIAGLGFLNWNLKTNEIQWSDEIYKIYGVDQSSQEITVDFTLGFIHPKDFEYVKTNLEMARKGKKKFDIDHRIVRSDGEVIWIHANAELVLDKEGEPEMLLGTALDITERKKAEEEVISQREVIARVARTNKLGQLTGSIAHELNQPLAGIMSNAQATEMMVMKGQLEKEELTEILADIVSDTKRAGEVIRNLRELYKEQNVEFLPVDINAVIEETLRMLHSEFVMQHVILTTESTPSLPLVNGNKVQIQQVLVNLILNSHKAMSNVAKKNRRLKLAATYDGNEVKVWVEDNGTGIAADNILTIFEPLVTWKTGGTGMGLAISNSIIESHGGKMWAENRQEGGARVGFIIPVQTENQQV
jgi:PAS domain S-box-containing protein